MKTNLLFLLVLCAFYDGVYAQTNNQQLIVNGNFADNECKQPSCRFREANRVKGWVPNPEIQIGFGCDYNHRLGRERVVELAGNQNTCLFQRVKNLTPGIYQLKYQYAAKDAKTFQDCQFKVSFNERQLKHVIPHNYSLNTDVFDFEVRQSGEGKIKFCGFGGPNNADGAVLKSVSLLRKANLPSPQPASSLLLDSHSTRCLEKEYNFLNGQLLVSLNYRILSNAAIKNSAVFITLDQQPIYRISPNENGKNVRISGNINKGSYRLGFCSWGDQNQSPHQVEISNLSIVLRQCNGGWGKDLIINGGFQKNGCTSSLCILDKQNGKGFVNGWEFSPSIEIGKAKTFNKAMADTWVVELDSKQNTCISQQLALTPGKYSLQFDWAGRPETTLDTCEFEVKVNDKVVKIMKPSNFNVNHETIEFNLSQCPPQSQIEFCGIGKSDGLGAVLDNVMLMKFETCAQYRLIKY